MGDSGNCEGDQVKLSQVGEKGLNPGFLEPTRAGGWRCLLEGHGRRGRGLGELMPHSRQVG